MVWPGVLLLVLWSSQRKSRYPYYGVVHEAVYQSRVQPRESYQVDPGFVIAGVANLLAMPYVLFDQGSYSRGRVGCNGRILDRLDRIEPCVLCRYRTLDARRCWSYSMGLWNSSSCDFSQTSLLVLVNQEDWQTENLDLLIASP